MENQDGVVTIRLNHPERLNALTVQSYADLENIFAELAQGGEAKV